VGCESFEGYNANKKDRVMAFAQLKWKIVDDVIIGVSGSGELSDAQWKEFIADMMANPVTKYLQFAVGATQLSSVQRKMGIDAVAEKKVKIVMVTDSTVVRGIVTAASWFGLKVSSWRPTQLDEAVKDLGVPAVKQDAIVKVAQDLAKLVE